MGSCKLPADPLHGDVLSLTSHSKSSPERQGNPLDADGSEVGHSNYKQLQELHKRPTVLREPLTIVSMKKIYKICKIYPLH